MMARSWFEIFVLYYRRSEQYGFLFDNTSCITKGFIHSCIILIVHVFINTAPWLQPVTEVSPFTIYLKKRCT